MTEKKFSLSEFFDKFWESYKKNPKHFIQPEQYKAVAALRNCRTESLGIDHYVCEDCGEVSYVYHSCKNRFCPTCSWQDTLDWADKMKEQMLPIPHRHVVFTLPHKLNKLIEDNKWVLLSMLFKSAAESIKDWMSYKYKLKPGIINVLHTFGETKNLHPHIHMILSWGGIDKHYLPEEIKGEYINYEFIQTKFRCKFEDKLVELYDNKDLVHSFENRIAFMRFLKDVNAKSWRIHFEPAMRMPDQVIRYIGRYSKRACISEYKITNIEGEYISFNYKDYKNLDYNGKPIVKELILHYNEFFPRLLQHVPLPYFRLVRYYGAYSARTKGMLKDMHMECQPIEAEKLEETEVYKQPVNPMICETCKIPKTYLYSTYRTKDGEVVYMTRFNPKKEKDRLKRMTA